MAQEASCQEFQGAQGAGGEERLPPRLPIPGEGSRAQHRGGEHGNQERRVQDEDIHRALPIQPGLPGRGQHRHSGQQEEQREDDTAYCEFLRIALIRLDAKTRHEIYSKALAGAAYMDIDEVRRAENLNDSGLEYASDLLQPTNNFSIASTAGEGEDGEPSTSGDDEAEARAVAELLQKIYLAVGVVITADEARIIANRAGADLSSALPDFSRSDNEGSVRAAAEAAYEDAYGRVAKRLKLQHDRQGSGFWEGDYLTKHDEICRQMLKPACDMIQALDGTDRTQSAIDSIITEVSNASK